MENQRYARTDDFKLIRYPDHHRIQLFNIRADPHELDDLSSRPDHADIITSRTQTLCRLQKEKGDGILISSL